MDKNTVMPLNEIHLAMIRQALGDVGHSICNSITSLYTDYVGVSNELEQLRKSTRETTENESGDA